MFFRLSLFIFLFVVLCRHRPTQGAEEVGINVPRNETALSGSTAFDDSAVFEVSLSVIFLLQQPSTGLVKWELHVIM